MLKCLNEVSAINMNNNIFIVDTRSNDAQLLLRLKISGV